MKNMYEYKLIVLGAASQLNRVTGGYRRSNKRQPHLLSDEIILDHRKRSQCVRYVVRPLTGMLCAYERARRAPHAMIEKLLIRL